MAAHRYWRLRFLNPVGYALVSIGEIEFRTSHGGTQASTGGTAYQEGIIQEVIFLLKHLMVFIHQVLRQMVGYVLLVVLLVGLGMTGGLG